MSSIYLLFLLCVAASCEDKSDAVVFPDEVSSNSNSSDDLKPRFFNFGVQPSGGGLSASGSFSSSFGHQGALLGHSGSQSNSFNVQLGPGGVSASQASSQASGFNAGFPGGLGPSFSGSQASSQSSGFSANLGPNFGNSGPYGNQGGSFSGSSSEGFSSGNQGFPGHSRGPGLTHLYPSFEGGRRRPSQLWPEFIRGRRPELRTRQQEPEYSVYSGVVVAGKPN